LLIPASEFGIIKRKPRPVSRPDGANGGWEFATLSFPRRH
jgi:hypothetical protein